MYRLSGQHSGLGSEAVVQFFFGLAIELFVTALGLSCSLPKFVGANGDFFFAWLCHLPLPGIGSTTPPGWSSGWTEPCRPRWLRNAAQKDKARPQMPFQQQDAKKRPPDLGGLFYWWEAVSPLCGAECHLALPTVGEETQTAETEDHHRPGRRLGDA
jgi:hypothetical protein